MSPIRMERVESAMRVVIAFNEAFNHNDVTGMMQLIGDNCVFENAAPPPDGTVLSNKEAITQYWQDFFAHSPHAHISVEEIFGYGFRCVMRWRYDWTDTAGNSGHLRGIDIYKVQNGSILEKLSYVKG